jgi:hypothetical protein
LGAALALALGLWSAWLAVTVPAPVEAMTLGPWRAWPSAGTASADPYARARLARTGEIPLGPGEGLVLVARTDSTGAPLAGACRYRIAGETPSARLWTIVLEDGEGSVLRDRLGIAAIGSDVLLRRADGTFEVVLSDSAQAGNWLPTKGADSFRIVMRLYDTAARTASRVTALAMPEIARVSCP